MKQLFIILFILSFAVCKSQTMATFSYPFTIQVQDSAMKELGYFRYDTTKGTVTTRGTLKASFGYFVRDVFLPLWELRAAQEQMLEYVLPDGTIIDRPAFGYAVQRYYAVKRKYGM